MATESEISALALLRRSEVEKRTGLSKTAIYSLIKSGRFPHPIAITARAKGWVESEISDWIRERISACRNVPQLTLSAPK